MSNERGSFVITGVVPLAIGAVLSLVVVSIVWWFEPLKSFLAGGGDLWKPLTYMTSGFYCGLLLFSRMFKKFIINSKVPSLEIQLAGTVRLRIKIPSLDIIVESQQASVKTKAVDSKTECIVSLMLKTKGVDTFRVIFLTTLLTIMAWHGLPTELFTPYWMCIGTIAALQVAGYFLLMFRISKGYYGSTAHEVKEILQFINDNSDDNIFGGGRGSKIKIFPESDETVDVVANGIPAHGGGR